MVSGFYVLKDGIADRRSLDEARAMRLLVLIWRRWYFWLTWKLEGHVCNFKIE